VRYEARKLGNIAMSIIVVAQKEWFRKREEGGETAAPHWMLHVVLWSVENTAITCIVVRMV